MFGIGALFFFNQLSRLFKSSAFFSLLISIRFLDSEISFSINSNSNNPITYGYVLDDSDGIATINQVENQYTIGAVDCGSFRVALTANDQINLVRDLANINVEISVRREYFLHDGTNEPAQIITQHGNVLLTESSV